MMNAPTEAPGHQPERDIKGKLLDTAIALSDLTMTLLALQSPIRGRGALAISLQAISVAAKVHAVWARSPAIDCTEAFKGWKCLDYDFKTAALGGVILDGEPVKGYTVTLGGTVLRSAYIAKFGGVELGYVNRHRELHIPAAFSSGQGQTEEHMIPVFCRDIEQLRPAIHARFWSEAPEGLLRITLGGKRVPYKLPKDCFTSGELGVFVESLRAFVDRGVPWVTLLDGEPGAGKTTAGVFAARELGLKAAILEAHHLITDTYGGKPEDSILYQLTDIIRPDVLIISDIDRLDKEDQLVLMELLDHIKNWAKLVFVSSNHRHKLLDAVDRPERIDDAVQLHGLTAQDIAAFAPQLSNADCARMEGWPIAYVVNVLKRLKATRGDINAIIDTVAERRIDARARWEKNSAVAAPAPTPNGVDAPDGDDDEDDADETEE